MTDLVLIDADIGGSALTRIRLSGGAITAVSPDVRITSSDEVLRCHGSAVIPGLHDHHVHLCAEAAATSSVHVGPPDVLQRSEFVTALTQAHIDLPRDAWIRAVGYHESVAGSLDRHALDSVVNDRPVRVQDRSGILWYLNSCGLSRMPMEILTAPGTERAANGQPTGRLFRMDDLLQRAVASQEVDLASISDRAASFGITGFTDATPTVNDKNLLTLARAIDSGVLRQAVTAMTGPGWDQDFPQGLVRGPTKILLDDRRLPHFGSLCETASAAHVDGRPVAFHCVTRPQIALVVAVLEKIGSIDGDRIEHGSLIAPDLLPVLAGLGITVVTNPGFLYDRGDTYIAEIERCDLPDLYRCASLLQAGVRLVAGTDAPFGSNDPWVAVRAAVDRKTLSGVTLGAMDRISPQDAVSLFGGTAQSPSARRRVAVGHPADLCVLTIPHAQWLRRLRAENVALCIIRGDIAADNR